MMQITITWPAVPVPRSYSYVDCQDAKGNGWCHLVSDPEETAREIREAMPDVTVTVRERRRG
jgi:hypothetical protein